MEYSSAVLPPECQLTSTGEIVRVVTITRGNGDTYKQIRPVARTLREAIDHHMDFYHPENGWILSGYKWAKDPADWTPPELKLLQKSSSEIRFPSYLTAQEAELIVKAGDT